MTNTECEGIPHRMLRCDKNIEVKLSDYVCFLLEQAHIPADLRAESEAEQGQGGAICQV